METDMKNYGEYWKTQVNEKWYRSIYNDRRHQHNAFHEWFRYAQKLKPIKSVCELGSGLGLGYVELFKNITYLGIDLNPFATEWCKKNYVNPKHSFITMEIISGLACVSEFDLVFSQGTIDNSYDVDKFLTIATRASRGFVYITGCRGFFADLMQHDMQAGPEPGVCTNSISPLQIHRVLEAAKCRNISITPLPTTNPKFPFELLIIAEV